MYILLYIIYIIRPAASADLGQLIVDSRRELFARSRALGIYNRKFAMLWIKITPCMQHGGIYDGIIDSLHFDQIINLL